MFSRTMYNHKIAYVTDKSIALDTMDNKYIYCHALKWIEESSSMCCVGGKLHLQGYKQFPEPPYSLIIDLYPELAHFINKVATSFGANKMFLCPLSGASLSFGSQPFTFASLNLRFPSCVKRLKSLRFTQGNSYSVGCVNSVFQLVVDLITIELRKEEKEEVEKK